VNGWHSDRHRERYLHAAVPVLAMACAYLAIGLSTAPWLILAAYVLTVVGTNAFQATFWLIPSDVLKGREAAVGVAAIGSIGMIGSFLGPYLWGIARDLTGGYRVGLLWLVVAHLIGAAILFVARRGARSPAALQAVAVTTA
jgi:MFS transporter, ACS family, tartrate transporter